MFSISTKKEKPIPEQLVEAFTRLGPAWGRWVNACLPASSVSFARIRLLQALETAGEATMSELALALEVTQRRITALVDALEEEGLVERRANPADRRSTLIAITPEGSRRQDVDWKRHQSDVALAFADLPAEQQRRLLEITPTLTEIMRRRAGERSGDEDELGG